MKMQKSDESDESDDEKIWETSLITCIKSMRWTNSDESDDDFRILNNNVLKMPVLVLFIQVAKMQH